MTADSTSVPCQIRAKHMYELPIKGGAPLHAASYMFERFAL